MFTGIIKQVGKVNNIKKTGKGLEIVIDCPGLINRLKIGDSIAVDGCCLTVTSKKDSKFTSDISYKTLENTTFKDINEGQLLNLEESLSMGEKIGGHFVSGHIDNAAKILGIDKKGIFYNFKIELKEENQPLIATRGSVTIDGISLTVAEKLKDSFKLAIIPHTYNNTNLKIKKVGSMVNLEVDLFARYIANYLGNKEKLNKDEILKEKLKKHGFI